MYMCDVIMKWRYDNIHNDIYDNHWDNHHAYDDDINLTNSSNDDKRNDKINNDDVLTAIK